MRTATGVWVKESGTGIWHAVVSDLNGGGYVVRCGWDVAPLVLTEIWTVHAGEPGPPVFERCQWCEAAAGITGR
jgi:hypothetical protein